MTDPSDFPFTFSCQRTGNCCARPGGVVRVTDADIEHIAAHLGLSTPAFRSRYLAAGGDRLAESPGPGCIFLEPGQPAACSIHDVRPEQCRTWPFWEELRDPDALRRAQRFCAGIVPRDHFENL